MSKAFEYRHVVGFEETNLVGNVYYTNYLSWQGRCREMFLRAKAPGVLAELAEDLALATVHCSCDYLRELKACDEIVVQMQLETMSQHRILMAFDYWRSNRSEEEVLVAQGRQEIACMRRKGNRLTPTPIPADLRQALEPYQRVGEAAHAGL